MPDLLASYSLKRTHFKLVQSLNMPSDMNSNYDGNVIDVNDTQFSNTRGYVYAIKLTLYDTFLKDVQFLNISFDK